MPDPLDLSAIRARCEAAKDSYLVWSRLHNAWWGPNNHGYRAYVHDAGRYTKEAAEAACGLRSPDKHGEALDVAVPEKDAYAFRSLSEEKDFKRRLDARDADVHALLAEVERLRQADDPEWDCTDAAHPAWWRGQEYGAHSVVRAMNECLGRPHNPGVMSEPLESFKRRILALRDEVDRLRAENERLKNTPPTTQEPAP